MNTRVSTFVYCLGTTNMEGENAPVNAMGILPILTPDFIPSTFSFSIVMSIRGIDDTCGHMIDIIFKDSLGNELLEAKNIAISVDQLKAGNKALPKEYRGIVLSMDLRNVIFKKEGVYFTEVYLDNKKMGEYDIYVKSK